LGTFNVRGLKDLYKKESLAEDVDRYKLDVLCLQETKISEHVDCNIGRNHRLVSFISSNQHYGIGFVISAKWRELIHKTWKVSDRISVLQLKTKLPEYECVQTDNLRFKFLRRVNYHSKLIRKRTRRKVEYQCARTVETKIVIKRQKPTRARPTKEARKDERFKLRITRGKVKDLISIINVYAPHSGITKVDPKELETFYEQLESTRHGIEKEKASSVVLYGGDFNARVGRPKTAEPCIGSHAKGVRNNNGQALVNFCNLNKLFIGNTAFQHPTRHITTWQSTQIDRVKQQTKNIFHQIDYIICKQDQKQMLQNARSYAGTQTFSDHRLVKAEFIIAPYIIHKQKPSKPSNAINTARLREEHVRREYESELREQLANIATQNVATTAQQKWDVVSNNIISVAERILGMKQKPSQRKRTHDPEIAKLSEKQKNIRLDITKTSDAERVKELRHQRNRVLKEIKQRTLENKEKELNEMASEVNKMHDHTQIFKSVKAMKRKPFENPYITDATNKQITNPEAMYNAIKTHFNNHFYDPNMTNVEPFTGEARPLDKPITTEEVSAAAKKLNNNRAPGIDRISAELIKYAPREVHDQISHILNEAIQKHQPITLGNGILVALQKPGKPKGPVKNLRPVILLPIIRKIMSIIVLARIRPAYEQYLSPSQSAYRSDRCTADLVWAHRWIIAKAHVKQIAIDITGLDLTAAFDTINREELLSILEPIVNEDEMRMIRLLLSNTTLEIRTKGVQTEPFESNIGSPQGDSISGVLFNIYLEDALRRIRAQINEEDIHIEHNYSRQPQTRLPSEMIYADDTDYPTIEDETKRKRLDATYRTLPERNLKVNEDKTEHTRISRGANEKSWRSVKKLGSLLGDREDIARRKQLATAAMNDLENVWIRNDRIKRATRLNLYNALVKPVLLYNCNTWGMSAKDASDLDAFHRQQLRRVLGIRWPQTIRNTILYETCNSSPISAYITRQRWKLFGHILRANSENPASRAMDFFFEPTSAKGFRGRPRTTIVTTLDNDLRLAAQKYPDIQIRKMQSSADLLSARFHAQNKFSWDKIIDKVIKAC
jgi:exonuclease III